MEKKRSTGSIIFDVIFYGFIALFIFSEFYVFSMNRVSGDSMHPTLLDKHFVPTWRDTSKIERGNIIVFEAKQSKVDPQANTKTTDSNMNYIKRVIGTPGDTVEQKDGYLYVNNKKVNEFYLSNEQRTTGSDDPLKHKNWNLQSLSTTYEWNNYSKNKMTVPKDCYFVMGDNRANSNDSRYFGFVKQSAIKGVAFEPFWVKWSNNDSYVKVNDVSKNFFE